MEQVNRSKTGPQPLRVQAVEDSVLDHLAVLDRHRVPAAPVLHELEALADPHLAGRGLFRPNGSPDTGTHTYPTHLWRWDGPPMRWDPLPVLGGDNAVVIALYTVVDALGARTSGNPLQYVVALFVIGERKPALVAAIGDRQ